MVDGVSGVPLLLAALPVGVGYGTVTEHVPILPRKVEAKTVRVRIPSHRSAINNHVVSSMNLTSHDSAKIRFVIVKLRAATENARF